MARRSQLIKDFKAGNKQKDASVLDTEKDTVEIDIEGKDIALHNRNSDAESDIVEDENDHVANAQRPIQATRANYLTPGDRIETSNYRADTATNNQQTSSREHSSQARLTAGTVEIATQMTSDSQVDEFIFQKAKP